MEYKTYVPADDLAGFVKCFWSLEGPGDIPLGKQRIVPDGCIEMIFHYGDPYIQYVNHDQTIEQPRHFVFGQITRPLDIEPTGASGIFAIRFYPEGFSPFCPVAPADLQDKATPLDVLYGDRGAELAKAVIGASSATERQASCEVFLMEAFKDPVVIDRVIAESVNTILKLKGRLTVSDLTEKTGMHRRQLERKFSKAIGISPKKLARVVRLQAALNVLLKDPSARLTALAYEGDFYDQAHFIKDFKTLTGQTPGKFFSGTLQLSNLFHQSE